MSRSSALRVILVLLVAGVFVTLAQQPGVKGGHYQHSSYSQPANESGYCYKRVPYNQARSQYNGTGSYPEAGHNHGGYNSQWNNTHDNGYVTILDCCEGYHRNPSTNRCETHSQTQCEGNCFGGICRNGVCSCEPGWYASEGACKPMCRRPCGQNAYCFAPDVCECKFGWEQSPYGDCTPICPGGCVNGECVAPRVCRCRPGYLLNEARQRCEAICEGGCTHGQCVAPGECQCDPGYTNPPGEREVCVQECRPGYIRDHSYNTCVPDCRHGCPSNARCTAPDSCECNGGFEMDYRNNRCIPTGNRQGGGGRGGGGYQEGQCDRPCINGVCMGYNICSCNEGFVPDPRDPTRTRCIAACPGGCPNGVCSGPNLCLCNPGYVKDRSTKGSQRCVPRQYNY